MSDNVNRLVKALLNDYKAFCILEAIASELARKGAHSTSRTMNSEAEHRGKHALEHAAAVVRAAELICVDGDV